MKKNIGLFLTFFILMSVLSCFHFPIKAASPSQLDDLQVYYLKNVYSQKYMDCAGTADSTRIIQNTFNGSDYQKFKLSLVDYTGSTPYYSLIPMINQNLRVDIDNARDASSTIVKAFTANGSAAQKFAFLSNGDSTYRIQLSYTGSGQVIEIAGPSTADGAAAQTWSYVGAKNQQWILESIQSKETVSDGNIKMTLDQSIYKLEVSSVALTVQNNSSREILFGKEYSLEKLVNINWQKYYPKDKIFWELIGYGLLPGGSMTSNLDLYYVSSQKLTAGKYRIVKEFSGDNYKIKIPIYAEFEVKE